MKQTGAFLAVLVVSCGGSVDAGSSGDAGSSDAADVVVVVDTKADSAPSDEDAGPPPVDVGPSCALASFGGVTLLDDVSSTTIRVHWSEPPGCAFTFLIFGATSPPGIDFKAPPTVLGTGGSTLMTGLTPSTTYAFAVRARDATGTIDGNTKVLTARTLPPSFKGDVQPILTMRCALSGCHGPPTPPAGMTLTSGFAYDNIVDVVSVENPPMTRVKLGEPDNSYLLLKIRDKGHRGSTTDVEIETIRQWIAGS